VVGETRASAVCSCDASVETDDKKADLSSIATEKLAVPVFSTPSTAKDRGENKPVGLSLSVACIRKD
jgi:hypothetical protein